MSDGTAMSDDGELAADDSEFAPPPLDVPREPSAAAQPRPQQFEGSFARASRQFGPMTPSGWADSVSTSAPARLLVEDESHAAMPSSLVARSSDEGLGADGGDIPVPQEPSHRDRVIRCHPGPAGVRGSWVPAGGGGGEGDGARQKCCEAYRTEAAIHRLEHRMEDWFQKLAEQVQATQNDQSPDSDYSPRSPAGGLGGRGVRRCSVQSLASVATLGGTPRPRPRRGSFLRDPPRLADAPARRQSRRGDAAHGDAAAHDAVAKEPQGPDKEDVDTTASVVNVSVWEDPRQKTSGAEAPPDRSKSEDEFRTVSKDSSGLATFRKSAASEASRTGATMHQSYSVQSAAPVNSAVRTEMRSRLNYIYRNQHAVRDKIADEWRNQVCARIIRSRLFTAFIFTMVALNALALCAQVQHEALNGPTEKAFFDACEYMFMAIFAFELAIRFAGQGRSFWSVSERLWNLFDIVLVSSSVLDVTLRLIMSGDKSSFSSGVFFGKFLKVMKMARVMRMARTVRFVGQLRAMLMMIGKSFVSLFWVLVVITGIIVMFSIVLTQGATEYIRPEEGDPGPYAEIIEDAYGNLFRTMYTLAKAMTGGVNWGEIAAIMAHVGSAYVCTIALFIFFTSFSVVNIVTGVFVDGAIEMARTDRTMMLEKTAQAKSAAAEQLMALLVEIDTDNSGCISYEEFSESLERQDVREYLDALQIDITTAGMLFTLMDATGEGRLDLVDFTEGMQRLKGEAKSADIQMILLQGRKLLDVCQHLVESLDDMRGDGT